MIYLFFLYGVLFFLFVLYVSLLVQYCNLFLFSYHRSKLICACIVEKGIYAFHVLRIYYNVWMSPLLTGMVSLICFLLQKQISAEMCMHIHRATHTHSLFFIGAPSIKESFPLISEFQYSAYGIKKKHPVESLLLSIWNVLVPLFTPVSYLLAPTYATFYFVLPAEVDNLWLFACAWWKGYLDPICDYLKISQDYLPKAFVWGMRPNINNPYNGEPINWFEYYTVLPLIMFPFTTVAFPMPGIFLDKETHVQLTDDWELSSSVFFDPEVQSGQVETVVRETLYETCMQRYRMAYDAGKDVAQLRAFHGCEHLFFAFHITGIPIERCPSISGGYMLYWYMQRRNIHPVMWEILNSPSTLFSWGISFLEHCTRLISYWGSLFFSFIDVDGTYSNEGKSIASLESESADYVPRIYTPHLQLTTLAASLFKEFEYAAFPYNTCASVRYVARLGTYIHYLISEYGEELVQRNYASLIHELHKNIPLDNPVDVEYIYVSQEELRKQAEQKENEIMAAAALAVQDIADWANYCNKHGFIIWASDWDTKGVPWYVYRGDPLYLPKEMWKAHHAFYARKPV